MSDLPLTAVTAAQTARVRASAAPAQQDVPTPGPADVWDPAGQAAPTGGTAVRPATGPSQPAATAVPAVTAPPPAAEKPADGGIEPVDRSISLHSTGSTDANGPASTPITITVPVSEPIVPLPPPPPTYTPVVPPKHHSYTPPPLSGFPVAPQGPETLGRKLHDWVAGRMPGTFDFAAKLVMGSVSKVTEQSYGLDAQSLLNVDRTMYNLLTPSRDGYVGGSPPLFVRLAQGQAAYVYIANNPDAADHLTRAFTGLPPETLQKLGAGNDNLAPIRTYLLNRLNSKEFMAYVNTSGDYTTVDGTDSIAIESLASIANRSNVLSQYSDPTGYYQWLVTRVDSAYRRTDPWLFEVNQPLHNNIDTVKDNLTPPWASAGTKDPDDPMGAAPLAKNVQAAYTQVMTNAGGGKTPTTDTLTDFADTAISLDRDLLFAVQTYWTKLLREVPPQQRESLFQPLATTWATLNVITPDDPDFTKVSPDDAPYIEIVDQHTGQTVMERYDRAMAMSEVICHSLDGLGIADRRKLMDTVSKEVVARQPAIEEREGRIRKMLGTAYSGLDVDGILSGKVDAHDPAVANGIAQLRKAINNGPMLHPMTIEHAELQRHADILSFMANRNILYPDTALDLKKKLPTMTADPLFVSEYYQNDKNPVTPLGNGPTQTVLLGTAQPGVAPLKMAVGFQGGGGKGEAFMECYKQATQGLASGPSQVAIDGFFGNSAGSITAGPFAAGYSADEMSSVEASLDLKKFYADYMWLAGGTDAVVRGVNRTGLFSTRQMYDTVTQLLKAKVPVTGRPVLFRDLPYKLTLTSTVVNTDLPDDLKKQLGIGPDGQMVFSTENTPNMDVAAAVCASASVPGFFNSPQIKVVRDEPDGQGGTKPVEYRLQMMDGGVVNNFPISLAADKTDKKPALVVLPAYYQNDANPPVALSVLDFDTTDLPTINAFNDQKYQAFAPNLGKLMSSLQKDGTDRAVLGFTLATDGDVPAPIIQGTTRTATNHLRDLATQAGVSSMDADKGADWLKAIFPSKMNFAEQEALNSLIGEDGVFTPSLLGSPQYHPATTEAEGIADVLVAVTAATAVAGSNQESKLFEKS